jgi:hypothetical protein
MGLGVAIGGGILSLTVLTVMLVIPAVMESITNVSESKSELVQYQQNLGDTNLQIDNIIAAENNDEFVFLLTNIGTTKLWDFENFDMFVTYDGIVNGITTQLTEPLTYKTMQKPVQVNCDGTVQGLSKGDWAFGTSTNDNLDPGILNPQESVQVSGRLDNKFAVNGSGTLSFTTDTGYFLSKTFSVVNGTEECAWYDINWLKRNKIVIHHEKVLANLTDFPVMINVRDRDLKLSVQTDGDDILFTAADKVTKLDHEIEYYDQPRGELTAWVKIPFLSSLEDTEIYMYYANDDATNQENSMAVWTNGYEAVYHIHDDFVNSTDNRAATNVGTTTVDGIIADGQDFENAEDDRINTGIWSVSGSELTIQTWAKLESYAETDARFISKASGTADQQHVFMLSTMNSGDDLRFRLKTGTDDASGTSILITNSNVGLDNWHFLAATYDGSNMKIYQNGALQGSLAKTGNLRENSWDIFIGANPPAGTTRNIDGILDEVRISSVARSIEWLQTEYNNIIAPQDFYTFEPAEPFLIWADLGWLYRKSITVQEEFVDADLDDFPLLVSVTDSDLTKAQSEGNDIIFTSSDGRVQLDHEMEVFDSSDGTVVAWVRVPTLQNIADTVLYMYYGHNTTTNVENIEEVWDSNYKAVYHLKEQLVSEKFEFETQDMISGALIKIQSSSDKFAMWAPRAPSNGGYLHTVDIEPDGSITGLVETQQYSSLGQDPDVIHLTGNIYAVTYEGPSERGWVVTSAIFSNATIGDYTGTRSSFGHLDAYSFEPSNEIDNPDIIKVGPTAYAIAFSGSSNDLFVETVDIPDSGWLITTIENQNNLDSDGDFPEIFNIGTDRYAIAYQDEANDGWIRTINIDSAGNIGAVIDSWEYQTSNGQYPDVIPISGDVYAIVHTGPGSDGWIRTVNITSTGTITKSGYHASTQFEFDTNTGNFPDIIQVFQNIYAIVYAGPGTDGYLKTLSIFPNGTIGPVIDSIEYDTDQGDVPRIDQVATNVFAIAYKGLDNDGYVATVPINNDGIIGDTALDSTSNDNTGEHISSPLGSPGKIGTAVNLEESDNNYILVSDSATLDITGPITLSAWVNNEDSNQAAWETILSKGDAYALHTCGTPVSSCAQGTTADGFTFAMSGPTGTTNLGSDVAPAADDWYYVVSTYDGTTQKIYVDGVLNQQQARSGSISTNSFGLAIGENLEQTGRYWDGLIDEIRISNSARSLEWIEAEFNNQNSPDTFMTFGPEQEIQ